MRTVHPCQLSFLDVDDGTGDTGAPTQKFQYDDLQDLAYSLYSLMRRNTYILDRSLFNPREHGFKVGVSVLPLYDDACFAYHLDVYNLCKSRTFRFDIPHHRTNGFTIPHISQYEHEGH